MPRVSWVVVLCLGSCAVFGCSDDSGSETRGVAPAITSTPQLVARVGEAYSYAVTATGTPRPELAAAGGAGGELPSWLSFDEATGVLAGTPTAGDVGAQAVTVTASNGIVPDAVQAFTLTVQRAEQAPAFISTAPTAATVGVPYTYTVVVSGSPAPTLSAGNADGGTLAPWLTFDVGTGLLTGTPAAGDVGAHGVRITAANGVAPNAVQAFTITVSSAPVAPAITSSPVTEAYVGEAYAYSIVATGAPTPALEAMLAGGGALPGWLSLAGDALGGTPEADDIGALQVTIRASNGVLPDFEQTFGLNVFQERVTPAFSSEPVLLAVVHREYVYEVEVVGFPAPTVTAAGADGGPLPSWLTFDGVAGRLSGTPTEAVVADHVVVLTAGNGFGEDAEQIFTIEVHQAPRIASEPVTEVLLGAAYSYTATVVGRPAPTLSATGADGGPLPSWLSFDATTGELSGMLHRHQDTGGHGVQVHASNGLEPDAVQSFVIEVGATQRGPYVDELVWTDITTVADPLQALIDGAQDIFMVGMGLGGILLVGDEPHLDLVSTFGLMWELSMNALPFPDTEPMNPLADAQIREALQWLLDRDLIVEDILQGRAMPFTGPFHPLSTEWNREAELLESLAEYYSYSFDDAHAQIHGRMVVLGAELLDNAEGEQRWHDVSDPDNPREIVIRIYAREDARTAVGYYLASQLEQVGLSAEVLIRTAAEASGVVFNRAETAAGAWSVYTGGWVYSSTPYWEDGRIWTFHGCALPNDTFCQSTEGRTMALDPALVELAQDLALARFGSLEERQQMIATLAPWTFQGGNHRMWLVANEVAYAFNTRLEAFVADLFGGPQGALTFRSMSVAAEDPEARVDGTGGVIRILNGPMFLSLWHPWPPTSFIYDSVQWTATRDGGRAAHPRTGRPFDFRVSLSLQTAGREGDPLALPEDAVVFVEDAWVPVPAGTTSLSRVVTHLGDAERRGRWHTGEPFELVDIVYAVSNNYRRAFYDVWRVDPNATTTTARSYLTDVVKGLRFDPEEATIEAWIDFWHMDPDQIGGQGLTYAFVPWELGELAVQSVLRDLTAFSGARATATRPPLELVPAPMRVAEQQVWPLDVLDALLEELIDEEHVPPGLEAWITPEQAVTRYEALRAFRAEYGHYWVGNGPFRVSSVDPVARRVRMEAFRDGYPLPVGFLNAYTE
jgi:hypothetical protein